MFLTPLIGYSALLIICIIFSFSVNCLIAQWVCLELNMLAVIPLLVSSGKKMNGEISIKYFVSQSVASLFFISSLMMGQELTFIRELVFLVLLFKLALPPFQSWMMSMLGGLGYAEVWVLFTVQKMIPLMILSQLNMSLKVLLFSSLGAGMFMLVIMSTILSLNLMLFISSVVNTIWMVSTTQISLIWLVYIFVYSYVLFILVFSLGKLKIYKLNDMFGLHKYAAFMVAVQLFNLGGVPPLVGFLLKLMMVKQLVSVSVGLVYMLVLLSLLLLFVYTSVFYQLYCLIPGPMGYLSDRGSESATSGAFLSLVGSSCAMWVII